MKKRLGIGIVKIVASGLFLVAVFAGFGVDHAFARENVTDWYIRSFDSQIVANKDSSLDITEHITADCGTAIGKHGIFRTMPERTKLTTGENMENPITLLGITDSSGKPLRYSQSRDQKNGTVTWMIGDPDKTVQGVNEYYIHYLVKNTIRFGDPDFDELYWNLNGNFWDLDVDAFHAKITFPSGVTQSNATVEYYAGSLGSKEKSLATYQWSAPGVLELRSTRTLFAGQGITVSVIFPKNIFTPYVPTLWETYGKYIFLSVPLIAFIICFRIWEKYGKDPKIEKTVIAEYEPPKDMSPLEIGLLMTNGTLNKNFITAEIIGLAVKKIMIIKEIDSQVLFFHSKNYEFTRTNNAEAERGLNEVQKIILDSLFESGDTVELSSLKDRFYKSLGEVTKRGKQSLSDKGLISTKGSTYASIFIIAIIVLVLFIKMAMAFHPFLGWSLIASIIIVLFFAIIMPKRTVEGAEMNWRIKGFKLFMETVDKDRAAFYEKENIFEKFLPYAVLFGITDIWIKRMKDIYGEDYFSHYAPVWYAGNLAAFDADGFSSAINDLSSDIASNTSAPSGSGGSGSAGGGGGGGGGGGW